MTEREWLDSRDAASMFEFLLKRDGRLHIERLRRCGRLFAVACCRLVWPILSDERSRHAVEAAERDADGLATYDELRQAQAAANAVGESFAATCAASACVPFGSWPKTASIDLFGSEIAHVPTPLDVVSTTIFATASALAYEMHPSRGRKGGDAGDEFAAIVRDIVGNPFREPALIDPQWLAWNDGIVVALARRVYEKRDYQAVPVLGDALEDAGCEDVAVLSHCREPIHVRGCWFVDAILGKK